MTNDEIDATEDSLTRLMEDFADDCVKAGYVTTSAPSRATFRAAVRAALRLAEPGSPVLGYAMALNEVALKLRKRYEMDALSTPLWAEFETWRNKMARSVAEPTPSRPVAADAPAEVAHCERNDAFKSALMATGRVANFDTQGRARAPVEVQGAEPSWQQTRIDFANATLRRMRELAPNMATVGALHPEVYREMVDKFHAALAGRPAPAADADEPVGEVIPATMHGIDGHAFRMSISANNFPVGTKLYTRPAAPLSDATIREVFMRNGFTIKEGQTDLKPYVYAAARELLGLTRPAAPLSEVKTDEAFDALSAWKFGRTLQYFQRDGYDSEWTDYTNAAPPDLRSDRLLWRVKPGALRPTPSNERG